jgi:hypothetical protein
MSIVPENLLTLGSQSTTSEYKSEESFEIEVDSVSPPSGERCGSIFTGSGAG